MTYQVTARRWRPRRFDEVVGQDHVVRTLKNAIKQNRLAHAYLFSGTRGVGKTTTARILAKSINCADGLTINPCEKCDRCLEISGGNSIDVIEIDGASNNSVEDIRDLRESVKYAPAKSRFKIYIIDEVHMLSKSAFNALLKTLEEPPSHVKFIFATTEEIKIPGTILSRCQCFEFRPISLKGIIFQLMKITKKEEISIGEESLALIARTAEGSMRDAESILDKIISFAGNEIKKEDIVTILGFAGFDLVSDFIEKIIEKKPAPLLDLFQKLIFQGQDLYLFLKDLLEYIRNLIVYKTSKGSNQLISLTVDEIDRLKKQAEKVSLDELHQAFKIVSDVEINIKRSSYPMMLVEMALIRLTEIRPFQSIEKILTNLDRIEQAIKTNKNNSYVQDEVNPSSPDDVTVETSSTDYEMVWEKIKIKTKEKKDHLGMFLDSGKLINLSDNIIKIGFSDRFTLDRMQKDENKKILTMAINEILNNKMQVVLMEIPKNQDSNNVKSGSKGMGTSMFDNEIIQDALNVFKGEITGEE